LHEADFLFCYTKFLGSSGEQHSGFRLLCILQEEQVLRGEETVGRALHRRLHCYQRESLHTGSVWWSDRSNHPELECTGCLEVPT